MPPLPRRPKERELFTVYVVFPERLPRKARITHPIPRASPRTRAPPIRPESEVPASTAGHEGASSFAFVLFAGGLKPYPGRKAVFSCTFFSAAGLPWSGRG